jgi:hypothetical protein
VDKFLGHGSTFWVGIEAIAVCAYTVGFTATLWLVYKQVRIAAKGFQLGAVQRLQQLVDDFRDDRRRLFTIFPLEIALTHEQFPAAPPGKHSLSRFADQDPLRLAIPEEQRRRVGALGEDQRELARRIIGRLNDIGQLIEDGLVDRSLFLGKYHVMLIQCCHLLEAVRRDEEIQRGGNYGQRLLRMRQWAISYNDIHPKHRAMPITITNGQHRRLVYQSPAPSVRQRVSWALRRWLS